MLQMLVIACEVRSSAGFVLFFNVEVLVPVVRVEKLLCQIFVEA